MRRENEPRGSLLGDFEEAADNDSQDETRVSKNSAQKQRSLSAKNTLKNKRAMAAKSRRVNHKKRK
ncbi:MAG: hypothetical protein AAB354_13995 [candidate division KSB1 bacterium]